MNNICKSLILSAVVAIATSAAAVGVMSPRSADTVADTRIVADSAAAPVFSGAFVRAAAHPAADNDFTAAAESTINGVVSIKSYATPRQQQMQGGFSDPFFEFFFGPQQRQQPQQQSKPKQQPMGLGSGVIISDNGYIATNNHVIDGAERLEVTLNDNRTFNATVIGSDPSSDLALIKIEAENLPVIPFGNSDNLKVGEWVLAVGNPFGFTSTVTAGIVSAKARSISSATNSGRRMGIESYIQTDAAVNPGNSGGALVNLRGELVGINTAIYSQTGNYAGYSFAIPTSIVAKIMADIKQYGTVQRAVLGIRFVEVSPENKEHYNVPDNVNEGLIVDAVEDRSSALAAGIQANDIIVAFDGTPLHNGAQLVEMLSQHSPGDKIKLTVVRGKERKTLDVTLLNNQGDTSIVQAATVANLGCAFKKLSDETKKQLKVSYGVQVAGLKDGKFKDAGIKDGFVILDINNSRVSSADDVEKIYNAIMKSNDGYDKVMFITGLYPTGKKMYYAVDLAQ